MELLDLPAELLCIIMHAYVDNVGVVQAWKARAVCREQPTPPKGLAESDRIQVPWHNRSHTRS
ncbi:hypothetical protein EJ04DRAFT_516360 [Polyplosphaeria fusca]|uniref:Uncharacterized protein n=1 Tax=Polyplosphaeria fusca TaxID=682080 RepID=A0A9P4QK71_9PLEO|nr:hypothetical protein EJ04DRAFT_516360 [Polyplosphaeria fusca]